MNSLLEQYRSQYDDPKSDAQLMVEWGDSSPEKVQQFPDAWQDYIGLKGAMSATVPPGPMDYAKEIIGSGIRGLAGGLSAIPKDIATGAAALNRQVNLDPFGGQDQPQDRALYKLGQGIDWLGEKLSPDPVPSLEQSFWATKVPGGLGTVASFITGGAAGKLVARGAIKTAGKAVAEAAAEGITETLTQKALRESPDYLIGGLIGAMQSGQAGYDEAAEALKKQQGISAEEANKKLLEAWLLHSGVGVSYVLPFSKMLKRLDGISGNTFTKTLIETGKEGLTAGVVNALASGAGDEIANNVVGYDKDRKIFGEWQKEFAVGGVIGTVASLITQAIGHKIGSAGQSSNAQKLGAAPESSGPADVIHEVPASPVSTEQPLQTATQLAGQVPHEVSANVQEIIQRQLSGENTDAMRTALAQVYADPNLHAIYSLEMRQAQQNMAAAAPPVIPREPSAIHVPSSNEEVLRNQESQVGLPEVGTRNPEPEITPPTEAQQPERAAPVVAPVIPSEIIPPSPPLIRLRHDQIPPDYRSNAAIPVEAIDQAVAAREAAKPTAEAIAAKTAKSLGLNFEPSPAATVNENEPWFQTLPPERQQEVRDQLNAKAWHFIPPKGHENEGLSFYLPKDSIPELIEATWKAKQLGTKYPPANVKLSPDDLINKLAFDTAAVTEKESGKGVKGATAYEENPTDDRLYTDRTAGQNKSLSRKLAVMETPGGGRVVVGTATMNGAGDNRRVTIVGKDGAPMNRRLSELKAEGYRVIAALKSLEPTKGGEFAVTYSPEEWAGIASQLREMKGGAQRSAARMEEHLTGVVGPEAVEGTPPEEMGGGELPARSGAAANRPMAEVPVDTITLKDGKKIEVAQLVHQAEVKGFGEEQAKTLYDEFGGGKIEADDAVDLVAGLRDEKADAPRLAILSLLTHLERTYGIKDEAELIALAAERISNVSGDGVGQSDFARRLVGESQGIGREKGVQTPAGAAHRAGGAELRSRAAGTNQGGELGRGASEVIPVTGGEGETIGGKNQIKLPPSGKLSDLEDLQFNPVQREIVSAIFRVVGDIPFRLVNDPNLPAAGFNGSDGILLNETKLAGKPNYTLRAIIHEAVHAATYVAIRDPSNAPEVDRLNALKALANQKWAFSPKSEMKSGEVARFNHAFKNIDEFVAALLSDGKFQEFLGQIRATDRNKITGETAGFVGTLLRGVWDAVAKLIGVRNGTVLSEALSLSENLLTGESVNRPLSESAALVRNRQATHDAVEMERVSTESLHAGIEGLEAAGLSVNVITDAAAGMVHEYGQYDNARKLVTLSIADPTKPTRGSLGALFEEGFHAIFAHEIPERQAAALQAVAGIADGSLARDAQLGKGPYANLTPEGRAEERFADLLTQRLIDQKFNPAEAKGFVRSVIRLVKELLLRATMAIQQSRFGEGHINPETARKYFENRLRSILAGDSAMTFLDFIGGRKLTFAESIDHLSAIDGTGMPGGIYSFEKGSILHPEPAPNMDASLVKWKDSGYVNQPETEISGDLDSTASAHRDIAHANELDESLRKAYDTWTAAGLNLKGEPYDKWLAGGSYLKPDFIPADFIVARNAELVRNGKQEVRPNTRVSDIPNASIQQRAVQVAREALQKVRVLADTRRTESAQIVLNSTAQVNKANRRIAQMQAHADNAQVVAEDAKEQVNELLKDMQADIKAVRTTSGKAGILTQTIRMLEGKMDEPLAKQYEKAINQLYAKLSGTTSKDNFADTLAKIAELQGIDWQNWTAVQVRHAIQMSADAGEPLLQSLVRPDIDSRAMLSIAVAFGKSNQSVMDHLALTRSRVEGERATINAALKAAMQDHAGAIKDARSMIKRSFRLAKVADRLIDALEQVKKDHVDRLLEVDEAKAFIDFHETVMPGMREDLARLESINGAAVALFEVQQGMPIFIPKTVDAKGDLVWRMVEGKEMLVPSTGEFTREELNLKSGERPASELLAKMEKIKAWVDSKPKDQRGASWAYLNQSYQKLSLIDKTLEHRALAGSITGRLLGSITKKLDGIGHPAARLAADSIRRTNYLDESFNHATDTIANGNRWEIKKRAAMKAVGWKGSTEGFDRLWYDRPLTYIQNRHDLIAMIKDTGLGETRLLNSLFDDYLSKDPDTRMMLAKPGVRKALEDFYRATTTSGSGMDGVRRGMGSKIMDKGPNGEQLFRETIGQAPQTLMRRWSKEAANMYRAMLPEWGGTKTASLTPDAVAAAARADLGALRKALETRFTPDVWQNFVKWITHRAARSLFYAPEKADGYKPIAMRERVIKAYELATPGDVVGFARHLYQLEGGKGDEAAFIGETLSTFQHWFDVMHKDNQELSQAHTAGMPVPERTLMDARRSEDAPAEMMSYRQYDRQSQHQMIKTMAFHAGGGRNLSAIASNFETARQELTNLDGQYQRMLTAVQARTGATGTRLRKALIAEAQARGQNFTNLENAKRNLQTINSMEDAWQGIIHSQLGVPMELRAFMAAIHLEVSLAVQGVKTAMLAMSHLLIQPVRHYGLTKEAGQHIVAETKAGAESLWGSLHYLWGKQVDLDPEHNAIMRQIGYSDPDAVLRFKDRINGVIMQPIGRLDTTGKSLPVRIAGGAMNAALTGARMAREALSTGIGRAQRPEGFAYPTLNLGAFTFGAKMQHFMSIKASHTMVETMLGKAVAYYEAHPLDAANKDFKLSFKDLGQTERGGGYLRESMAKAGMDLNLIARNVVEARKLDPKAPLMTLDQYRNIGVQSVNENTLQSNMVNNPPSWLSNPWLAAATPLVGWQIKSMAHAIDSFREPDGQKSWKGFKQGSLALMGLVPIGLAYAALLDEYDKQVQGRVTKEANFFHNPTALTMLENASRVGVAGIAGDAATAMFNADSNRPFSADSRIFFVSSMLNALHTMGAALRQGSVDYQSFYRPMMTAMGGTGFLQYVDTINHVLGADNAEARVVARMNVSNYLRVAGRDLGLEVRTGSGQASMPTPIKPFISQMVLAAYANDPTAFREAWHSAVLEAREEKRQPNAEDYVARVYAGYHPLKSVFRVEPTTLEYRKILQTLDADGAEAIRSAIHLYNRFGEQIGAKPNEGRTVKQAPVVHRTMADLRMRAAAY